MRTEQSQINANVTCIGSYYSVSSHTELLGRIAHSGFFCLLSLASSLLNSSNAIFSSSSSTC